MKVKDIDKYCKEVSCHNEDYIYKFHIRQVNKRKDNNCIYLKAVKPKDGLWLHCNTERLKRYKSFDGCMNYIKRFINLPKQEQHAIMSARQFRINYTGTKHNTIIQAEYVRTETQYKGQAFLADTSTNKEEIKQALNSWSNVDVRQRNTTTRYKKVATKDTHKYNGVTTQAKGATKEHIYQSKQARTERVKFYNNK